MSGAVRWGVWGTGRIAHRFTACAGLSQDASFLAVASRSLEKAHAFAAEFRLPRAYQGLDALLADPDVEAVYITSPHQAHAGDTLRALMAGKHVLCEKPFSVNAREAEDMVDLAREKRLFLMEGMWTRFFPATRRIMEVIASGAIGDARMVTASFGFRTTAGVESRIINPETAGGSLLDLGVYVLSYASMVFGGDAPEAVEGVARIGAEGVDEQCAASVMYSGGRIAAVQCGVRTRMVTRVNVYGENGMIEVPDFYHASRFYVEKPGETKVEECHPYEGEGFQFEMDHVSRCIRGGLTESPLVPLDESVRVMRTMDALRSKWGLSYPFEMSNEA